MPEVMNAYEAARAAKIKRNAALLANLGLPSDAGRSGHRSATDQKKKSEKNGIRKRKFETAPTRVSARVQAKEKDGERRVNYNEDALVVANEEEVRRKKRRRTNGTAKASIDDDDDEEPSSFRNPPADLDEIRRGWTSWTAEAEAPTRDVETGRFHFASHPEFTPNKSPEEIIREGSFGGSYWRPLRSRTLATVIQDDWRELPASWTNGLNVERYLTSPEYDPSVNKFGVACGQSIEAWEAAGWIAHEYDVRGWFQWYCRFYQGRRCDDDDRQVSRWKKCVGSTGRWRRILLKKYVTLGIREVFDDGEEEDEDRPDVSPVVHQTCLHWAFELRQADLEAFWRTGK